MTGYGVTRDFTSCHHTWSWAREVRLVAERAGQSLAQPAPFSFSKIGFCSLVVVFIHLTQVALGRVFK